MMGNRLKRGDPSIQTHDAYYENVASEQDVNIVENVPEYEKEMETVKATLGPGWDVSAVKLDPRVFGLGVARARIYIVAIRTSKLQWKPQFSMQEFIDAMTSQVSLVATDYWWKKLPRQILSPADETWLHFITYVQYLQKFSLQNLPHPDLGQRVFCGRWPNIITRQVFDFVEGHMGWHFR